MNAKIHELLQQATAKLAPTIDCTRCNATGKVELGKINKDCPNCRGLAFIVRPDLAEIYATLCKTGKLRSTRPKYGPSRTDSRLYYVWRIARFDGGADVTMPVMAGIENHGDPYMKVLDELASIIAKVSFGTEMAGALRWGPLLGGITTEQAQAYMDKHPQPMTAEPSGPVVIGPKPESEEPELH